MTHTIYETFYDSDTGYGCGNKEVATLVSRREAEDLIRSRPGDFAVSTMQDGKEVYLARGDTFLGLTPGLDDCIDID